MPRLYCEEHGKEAEARSACNQERYRQEGETILVVTGALISGPWLCDRCNAQLDEDEQATLVSAFPRAITESIYEYDFGYEQGYFAMEDDTVTVYGAEWPGVS